LSLYVYWESQVTMKGLTRRQQDVLAYIEDYVRSRGYPPSVREIASHFSLVSASGVHKHIKALVKKNFLAKQDFTSRSIRVIRRSTTPRPHHTDSTRWPFYGVLTPGGIRARATGNATDWKPSDPTLSSGGIVVEADGADYATFGVLSGDLLFVTAQVPPRFGDLILVEQSGRAELLRAGSGPTSSYEGLRGVVVGMWRPLYGPVRN
jgi:repressor LexA